MRRICVFCGSHSGNELMFKTVTEELGNALANLELELVYGGGCVGLMGILADAVLAASGRVIGVMPESLVAKEIAHVGLNELKVVKSMHERKAMMAELADGFIALPGGFGTLEEFCEVLTWSQLGFHKKPCALLNTNGYYDELLRFFDTASKYQFVPESHRALVLVSQSPVDLLNQMKNYKHTAQEKWLTAEQIG